MVQMLFSHGNVENPTGRNRARLQSYLRPKIRAFEDIISIGNLASLEKTVFKQHRFFPCTILSPFTRLFNMFRNLAILLFLPLLLVPGRVAAEGMPINVAQLFLESDLIVYGEVVSENNETFKVRVHQVWRDRQFGIESGNYLRIKSEVVLSCGFVTGIVQEVGTAVFCLKKDPTVWRLTNNEFIPRFYDGKAQFTMDECTFRGNAAEWKKQLKSFFQEFKLDSQGKLKGRLSAEAFAKSDPPSIAQHCYLQMYPELAPTIRPKLDCYWVRIEAMEQMQKEAVEDTTIYVIVENPATPVDSSMPADSLMKLAGRQVDAQHPELKGSELRGRTILSLLIEKDGKISKIEVLRSSHPDMDKSIIAFFKDSSPWNPAMNHRKQAVRFRTNVVVKYGR